MKVGWTVVFALLLVRGPARADEKTNSCAFCHKTAAARGSAAHSYADWADSAHAKAGVTCDACHGGDPTKSDREGAHAGLRPSTDEKSPVYYTRIPGTCGACHRAEGEAFKKSAHYRELQTSGRGPNCVTCHGAMANHILAPRDLETTCTLCHRRPTGAHEALLMQNDADDAVEHLKAELRKARAQGVDESAQKAEAEEAAGLLKEARKAWHSFDLPAALKAAREAVHKASIALNELQLKEQQKP